MIQKRGETPESHRPTWDRVLQLLVAQRGMSRRRSSSNCADYVPAICTHRPGGVYKWQGRNRHSLMSCAYETFLVARPIIAILGPKWVYVIPVFPPSFGSSGSDQMVGILVLTDIVVRVSPRTLRSITDLLLPKISPCAKQGILQRRNPLGGNSS